MGTARVKCPKCGKRTLKKVVRLTKGRCPKCAFLIALSSIKFSTARFRVQSRYRR